MGQASCHAVWLLRHGVEDGVEDGEELAHGGGAGELGGLAAGDEAGIEGADGRIRRMAVRVGMYRALRTLARPPRTMRRPRKVPLSRLTGATPTRLAISAPIEGAEFGQLGDQGAGRGLADARDRGEQVLDGAPGGAGAHGVVEIGLDLAQLLLQPGEVARRAGGRGVGRGAGGGAGPRCRSSRRSGGGGRPARRARAPPRPAIGRGSGRTRFGEARDGLGIQPIGLGEPAGGAGEVADLARD